MPLNVSNFVHKGALLHEDVGQFADLLMGVMTDQPVTLGNTLTLAADPTQPLQAATKQYVDAIHGVPAGGTTGQVLSKSSAANWALAWTTPATGVTWPLLAPDSSAIAPSYSFANGPGTGIFYQSSSILVFATSQAARWRILNTGHFTANTDNALDIGASGATRPRSLYLGSDLLVAGRGAFGGNAGVFANVSVTIGPTAAQLSSANQQALYVTPIFSSTATTSWSTLELNAASQAATFTTANAYFIHLNPPNLGAGHSVTNLYGLNVPNVGVAAVTNAYGISIAAQSGAATTNIGLRNQGSTLLAQQVSIGWQNPDPHIALNLVYNFPNGTGGYQIAQKYVPGFSSDATGGGGLYFQPTTSSGTITLSAVLSAQFDAPNYGAGTTVGNQYGIFINNQGRAGITNAYGIWLADTSGASGDNSMLVLGNAGRRFRGYSGAGYDIIALENLPVAGTQGYVDLIGSEAVEMWINYSRATGGYVDATKIWGRLIATSSYAGGGLFWETGNAGSSTLNGNRFSLDKDGNVFTAGGKITFGSAGEYIRNPPHGLANLSIESSDGYVFVSSKASTFLGGNTYWDGTLGWNRYDTAQAASYISTIGSTPLQVSYVGAGANPIAGFTSLMSLSTSGVLTAAGGLTVQAGPVSLPAGSIARPALSAAASARYLGSFQGGASFTSSVYNTWQATPITFNITIGPNESGIVIVSVGVSVVSQVIATTVYGAIAINGGIGLYQMVHIPGAGYSTALSFTQYFSGFASGTHTVQFWMQANAGPFSISGACHVFMVAYELVN